VGQPSKFRELGRWLRVAAGILDDVMKHGDWGLPISLALHRLTKPYPSEQ
jgi:hypothetical protein